MSTYREGELEAIVEMAMHLKENATDVNDALNEVENYLQILKNLSIEVILIFCFHKRIWALQITFCYQVTINVKKF